MPTAAPLAQTSADVRHFWEKIRESETNDTTTPLGAPKTSFISPSEKRDKASKAQSDLMSNPN